MDLDEVLLFIENANEDTVNCILDAVFDRRGGFLRLLLQLQASGRPMVAPTRDCPTLGHLKLLLSLLYLLQKCGKLN